MKDFNFFSFYVEGGKNNGKSLRYGVLTAVVAGFVMVSAFGINYIRINKLSKEIVSMEQVINSSDNKIKLKEIGAEEQKVSILKEYYTKVESIYNRIITQDMLNSKVVNMVSSCIPKDVYFKTVSMDSSEIQIQGEGINRVVIAELEHNLKNLDIVENVHIASIGKASEENAIYVFSLKCMLKDVVNNENN